MIEKIIDFSVRNIFLTLFVSFSLALSSIWAFKTISLDALPDLSPPQVIVQVKWAGQSPKVIEDQVGYALVSNLMSLPNIKTVRAMSSFENALIYIIFKDGVDIYEARNRILEQLSQLTPSFPKGAKVTIGPDATGIGWAYEYALTSKTKSLDELRTLQDYYFKYALLGVDGVSEVASLGGFVKNYEITLDMDKLAQYNISTKQIVKIIQQSNNDKGGRIILENGFEQIITANGYLKTIEDIENITIQLNSSIPLKLKDIANIQIVPANRRGMADLNGQGEVVGGIVVVRYKENTYEVIKNIKAKLKTLNIPDVKIVQTYDRTSLIDKAIATLNRTLIEESIIVMIVALLFLFHFRSALIIIIVLPVTVSITFLLMKLFSIDSNIMSLGGIAIAIGAMVDAAIVMVENAHKHIHKAQINGKALSFKRRVEVVVSSSKQVGRPIFFALILIVISFLPIFALTGQEGRLFTPLAYTKTFAMMVGAILSITLVPILMIFLMGGKIKDEKKNPINRFFQILYLPILKLFMKIRYLVLIGAIVGLYLSYALYEKQKWEFMPMMNEQTFMYMPVTPYGISIDQVKELTIKTDEIIKSFPEVATVFGKAGRADTATDPAPLAMIETIITFKPQNQWRTGMTYKKLMRDMDKALQIPGLINSWTYPIRGRIDMLLTGIRTPLGIKLYGNDHAKLEATAFDIEQKLKTYKGTLSVSSDKANSGYYLDIKIIDEMLSRYGITKETILNTISYGVGGDKISTIINGLERYPISIRYESFQREDLTSLKQLKLKTKYGFFPLETFATLKYTQGPSVIKSEKGMNVNFIYITPKENISSKTYKDEAVQLLKSVKLPSGFYFEWAGQSEYLESAMQRLQYIIPATFIIVYILIYFALGNMIQASIIFFTLPVALAGGLLYIDMLNFNMSIAVIVGFLALLGVAAETSIVMIIYLKEAIDEKKELLGKSITKLDIKQAIYDGAAQRLRPKLMTVFAILGGLIPIMYITSVGSEVMQRIAAPMIGGMVSSSILTLILIPLIIYIVESFKIQNKELK
jgi:Cu(I)/Ag(I) efflux system membrane protein CusA/SilA